ncbi:MAG: hypothetical protein ACLQPD_05230 [Desulfomonilaceae bacterium]
MTCILIALICMISWINVSVLTADASCNVEAAGWTQTYEALARGIESCRYLKQESITARIEQELEKEPRRPMAQSVQEVLKERSSSLEQAKTMCLELAERERSAYAEWRRCAGAGAGRRGRHDLQGPDGVARQRNELLASLQDVLLDEAYAQYKNYRDPSRGSYTTSDQNPYVSGQTLWPR